MRIYSRPSVILRVFAVVAVISTQLAGDGTARGNMKSEEDLAQKLIAMETAALDRWRQGDPDGFLEIIAEDYTYFDPELDKRIDGYDGIKAIYDPIRGNISFPRYELIDPKVQVCGDMAVLTFNFKSFGPDDDGNEVERTHWHTTEVFRRIDSEWKLVSTHWSWTKSMLRMLAESGQLSGDAPVEID